jgi:hypothetical protein
MCYHGVIYPEKHLKEAEIHNIKAYEFEQVPKSDYLKQELLEEAKRMYISGTHFIPTARGYRKDEVCTGNLHWCDDRIEEKESGRGVYDHTEKKWAEIIKEEERKPLFTFDGHEYFEGSEAWGFTKKGYKMFDEKVMQGEDLSSYAENENASKIYPTEALCHEGLYNWIWENRKVTGEEGYSMMEKYKIRNLTSSYNSYKDFYCEQIINQKQS